MHRSLWRDILGQISFPFSFGESERERERKYRESEVFFSLEQRREEEEKTHQNDPVQSHLRSRFSTKDFLATISYQI